jgi:hypothetical protein
LADKKRTIEGYEIIHAVELGGGELILGENPAEKARYMVCDCNRNNAFGAPIYENALASADFVEIMKLFAQRLSERVIAIETERETRGIPLQIVTREDCYPVGHTDLEGCVVVIKPELLAPEYRSIDYQLALCTGGFGANPDSGGRTVFCKNLITGETEKYRREDIAGTVSESRLPEWARINLEALRPAAVKESEAIASVKPLDKEQFWQMIDTARETAGGWQSMYEPLLESLAQLEEPDIIRFKQIFDEYQTLAYKDKLWGAATLINGGCSDDGFIDFRGWLTSQGKEAFMNALADPDSLAGLEAIKALGVENHTLEFTPPNGYQNKANFEAFVYIASYAYERKLGSDADIYSVLNKSLLSNQEKADIAGEIKYAADIDSRTWRGGDSWMEFMDNVSVMLPNLHKVFNNDETLEASAEIDPPNKPESRAAPAEKESVLDAIKQDKQKRQGKQKPDQHKPKTKKTKKDGPEL